VPAAAVSWHLVEQRERPAEAPAAPHHQLDTHREVFADLDACYRHLPIDRSRPGMQITFQLSFRRDGSILGEPRITYETPEAAEDQRYACRLAVAEALTRCTPLPFSESLGWAVAGRPFTMRIIDSSDSGFESPSRFWPRSRICPIAPGAAERLQDQALKAIGP
jgi:hypothetical protein